jgi:hypothetical protein
MTISEWLLLAQTLVLFFTGIVILWYTWETQQLRKSSAAQAEVLKQQLETMRQTLQMDIQEQIRESTPFIRWGGGSESARNWSRDFVNEGGPIAHLSIRTDADLVASIAPRDFLRKNQQGEVTFQARGGQIHPDGWTFEIRYRTQLNQPGAKRFIVENKSPREIEPE